MSLPPTKKERHTVEDYLSWGGDGRLEIIDGVEFGIGCWELIHGIAYDRSQGEAPDHQLILMNLHQALDAAAKGHALTGGGSATQTFQIFARPLDVVLGPDSVVQPDILAVRNPDQIKKEGILGAPDLVVELISPLTSLYDRREKLKLYEESGVREYLIVDIYQQLAERHRLGFNGRYETRQMLGEDDALDLLGMGILGRLGDLFHPAGDFVPAPKGMPSVLNQYPRFHFPKPEHAEIDTIVEITEDQIHLRLMDGRELVIPTWISNRLHQAALEDLAQVEITPGNDGLHWEVLDEDLSLKGFLGG